MQKRAPTLGNILVIILFVLSCFGLLMFLWESFGGPLPLKPKGYRMSIAFPRVLALSEQSDVRISGVDIGHVISVKKGGEGRTIATVEISSKYAPIRQNMHAIIRQKTLLGETYIQLIPQNGGKTGPYLADNGRLPASQVEPQVTLDDILSAFDPKTRADFRIWQQAVAEGINGRGEQINADFARLEPFAEHANKLVSILDTQEGAVRALVHNTGVVFNALASRDHQLEGLIVNGEHTFKAASEASEAFAAAFRALPGFERHSKKALQEIDRFAEDATPFLEEFRTPERRLSALVTAAKPFAPEFDRFLTSLGPLTKAARTGLPDLGKSLTLTEPRARKPASGAAQPRSVPRVRRHLRARDPGVLREPHLGLAEPGVQHRPAEGRRDQAAPADDAGDAEPAEPRAVRRKTRQRPLERVPAARHLQPAGDRPAGVQRIRVARTRRRRSTGRRTARSRTN